MYSPSAMTALQEAARFARECGFPVVGNWIERELLLQLERSNGV
jgi:hypothetical protein